MAKENITYKFYIFIIFSLFILPLITFIIYYFSQYETLNIEIDPFLINAPRNSIMTCYKNQFKHDKIWKSFDYNNSTLGVEIKRQQNFPSYSILDLIVSKQHQLFNFIDYKITTVLDVEYSVDEKQYSINSFAVSKNGLVKTFYTILLELGSQKYSSESTIIKIKAEILVPRIFSSFTEKTTREGNLMSLNKMKTILEEISDFCNLSIKIE